MLDSRDSQLLKLLGPHLQHSENHKKQRVMGESIGHGQYRMLGLEEEAQEEKWWMRLWDT